MRREKKKVVMTLFIILVFGMSSIAFLTSGLLGVSAPPPEIKQLTSFVVEGEIDPDTENAYISSGVTFLKVYLSERDPAFEAYLNGLPQALTTPAGQVQLVVQKFNAGQPHASIVNAQHDVMVNLTRADISAALCTRLLFAPIECALENLTGQKAPS